MLTTVLTVMTLLILILAFGMLILYSLNLYFLMTVAWVRRRQAIVATPQDDLPLVTVQIPLFNERHVSRRIIDAVARLDWPRDRLQIQVLDDSTDDTRQIVADHVQLWRARGVDISLVHRPTREGFKAGALACGMPEARGEFIAIFDADFIPPSHFLRSTVPALMQEPRAAFIQTRWDHLNREESWLTRIQSILLDGHFAIEQFARCYGGFAFNFNGTAGVWRRTAIEDAGGWKSHTLTEDLDLSYRAWIRGWRGLYRRDIASPAELPPTMTAFRRQQARWAQGGVECARLLLRPIWRSQHGLLPKIQATMHLLGYLLTSGMVTVMLCYPLLVALMHYHPESGLIFTVASLLGPITIAPTIFYIVAQSLLRPLAWRTIATIVMAQVLSLGMAMNTLRATIKAMIGQRGEFLRTPKFGGSAARASSYRLRADVSVLIDVLWGLFCLLAAVIGIRNGHTFVAVYGLMSCAGSWWVALWTVWPDLRAARTPRAVVARTVKSA